MWAAEYSYKGTDGWYLPAVDELAAIGPNIEKVNETLTELGGVLLQPLYSGDFTLCSSTTEVKDGADTKTIYIYNFTKAQAEEKSGKSGSEYFGYIQGRAFKKVTKAATRSIR